MLFHKHVFKVFSYIKMSWFMEILIFIILIPCDVVSYILGCSLIRKRVQSKYNVIVSKFKMFFEIERYVHNHYDIII
jgi:hypothetical protein